MSYQILHGSTAQPQALATAASFDTLVGMKQPLVQMFWSTQQGFRADGTTPQFTNFPIAIADGLWKRGQLYFHSWSLYDWVSAKAWLPADILAGKYDQYFHAQAATLKAWQHPLFIRLDHEFNGSWSTFWKSPQHEPSDFVSIWHYVVSLFRSDGVKNVTWVWCPNELDPPGSASSVAADKLAAWMPDPADFDWTGIDCYNWGASQTPTWWRSLPQMFDLSYSTVANLAPTKPMILAEFGCHPIGGDRNAWLTTSLAQLAANYPLIAAINYYNVSDGVHLWPLLSADGSARAWSAGVARSPYVQPGFPMPPDNQTIVPLQTVSAWGDPLGPLNAQLAKVTAQLASTTSQLATLTADATTMQTTLEQAAAALAAANALAVTRQSALEASNALLGKYADNVRSITDGLAALRALQA
jgi:hypothetical protein